MSDILTTGNKRDKWTLRATDLINWLYNHKSAVLVEGDNITLTPQEDGTIEISASGGGEGTVTDVLVDGVSVVNQDGEAEIDLSDKQDKLVAGTNIQIGQDGKTISATDTTYSDFVGATSQQAGTHGLVPAPLVIEKDKFLKGDGTWGEAGGGNVDDVVMNGQSIVDTNKVASFNNYVELTQSEYDALPDSKLTDGILYCIKDTGIVEGEKFAPVIYSLEEREVGVWTDGKPLYQKTITGTTDSSSNTTQAYDLATNNIQTVVSCVGYVGWTNSYGDNAIRNLSGYADSNAFGDWGVSADGTKLLIFHGNYMRGKSYVITLQYTKTTDVPGSGTWTPSGVPAHHYSTEEQVIGTWFGETLYEKTVYFTTPTQSQANTEIIVGNIGINNATILRQEYTFYCNGSLSHSYNDGVLERDGWKSVTARIVDGYIYVKMIMGSGSVKYDAYCEQKAFVIVQYTKTTD